MHLHGWPRVKAHQCQRIVQIPPIKQTQFRQIKGKARAVVESQQQACRDLWPSITSENLSDLTDYTGYKQEFLRLFGFGLDEVDYDADVNPDVQFDVVEL